MSSSEIMPADEAEALCLAQPQVGCTVTHHFGPGVYLRQCTIPAGVFVISHRHRFPHSNIMLAGAIAMNENDGPIHVLRAPHFYSSPPGRKTGLALMDVVWLNIYATAIVDVEELELQLFDKSPAFLDLARRVQAQESFARDVDRQDFQAALDEMGVTPYEARAASERLDDQVPLSTDWGVLIRPSAIEGRGVFIVATARPGDMIAPARIAGKRTPVGRYTNHSRTPNAKFVEHGSDVLLVATAPIAPYCSETVPGDEVVVDYRQVMSLVGRVP